MNAPANVAAYLHLRAQQTPFSPAVIFPTGKDRTGRYRYTHLTYSQLEAETNRIARGLLHHGITSGTRAVLMVPPSLEFFTLTFAFLKSGVIPVMIDPGMGLKNVKKCLAEAEPEAFVGVTKAHVARICLRWSPNSIRHLVTVGHRFGWGGITLDQLRFRSSDLAIPEVQATPADQVSAILFTSGSTGVPKGAIYTHGIFTAQVKSIRETWGIEPGEIDLCTFPLFALFAPALGMTAVIPDMDATRPAQVNPENIIQAMNDFGPTNMFGSPALLNRVGNDCVNHSVTFPTIRRVICAGAPIHPSIMEKFQKVIPEGAEIFSGYGATEALPVATIGSHEILNETRNLTDQGNGTCVGKPLADRDVAIIRISDDPISDWDESLVVPNGTIGEITVKGPVVTTAYFNRPESTRLAKIREPATGAIRHRMGDLGYFDEAGRLWFCGRKTHRVCLSDQTLYTVPCEGVFNAHPKVFRTALVGVTQNGNTIPVICVELLEGCQNTNQKQIRRELLELGSRHPHTQGIHHFLFHPNFPVDIRHNSKIFRENLAVWAGDQLK